MILVTGGTGTSGQPIVKALLDRGQRIRVLARDPAKAAVNLGDDVDIARGDLFTPHPAPSCAVARTCGADWR